MSSQPFAEEPRRGQVWAPRNMPISRLCLGPPLTSQAPPCRALRQQTGLRDLGKGEGGPSCLAGRQREDFQSLPACHPVSSQGQPQTLWAGPGQSLFLVSWVPNSSIRLF